MRAFSFVAFSVFFAACTASPPPGAPVDVKTLAGHWRSPGITLDIAPNGDVAYHKEKGVTVQITGAMSDPTTTGFDVEGIHFVLSALPAKGADGETHMTVDGEVLTLQTEENKTAPPPASLPAAGTLESLVGVWEGDNFRLHIEPDGTIHYRRGGTSIDGVKVHDVTAASFKAGVLGIDTTFVVSAPPAVVDGKVQMTVDGVVLTQTQR